MGQIRLTILTGMCFCFLWSASVQAADPPPSTDASVQQKKIMEAARTELLKGERKKPEIEEEALKKKEVPEIQKKFLVQNILIQGNQAIRSEELDPILASYRNRELNLADANELAQKIEQEYRRRGFITTLAYVPPQTIENETLKIEILEGKFGKLFIEGNHWFSDSTIRRYWHIREGEVLRYKDLLTMLNRVNENPDRKVQAVLKAGEKAGATDVQLKVKDYFPYHAGYQFDNQGVRSTGKRRHGFTAKSNNFIIPDSILLGGFTFGSDFGAVFGQYLIPVTSYGTKLILGFSHSQVAPKREFEIQDIDGISQTYSAGIRQNLYETDRFTSVASVGFDFKDSRTKDVTGTRRRDRLRVVTSGLDFTYFDRFGGTSLANLVSFGTKIFGATSENNPLAGRAGAEPEFVKYEGTLSRSIVLPFETMALLKFSPQVSTKKLTPQEELSLGGANSVRGYPEGDYLADQGFLFNAEYSIPSYFLPHDWQLPKSDRPLRKDVQVVFFFDEGYGRLRGVGLGEIESRHLMGAGGGLRIRLTKYLYARVELAHVIGHEPLTDSDHTRLHFTLQTEV